MSAGSTEEFDLLSNDSDGDGDPLTIVSVGTPQNGAATLLPSGNIRYTPRAGFSGTDFFSYTAVSYTHLPSPRDRG